MEAELPNRRSRRTLLIEAKPGNDSRKDAKLAILVFVTLRLCVRFKTCAVQTCLTIAELKLQSETLPPEGNA